MIRWDQGDGSDNSLSLVPFSPSGKFGSIRIKVYLCPVLRKTARDTMTDLSIYLHIISSDACGGVRTMAFPFIKNGMANPLDILVLRKERQNELFGRKIKTCPLDFFVSLKQVNL